MSEFNWTPEEIAGIVNENRLVLFMKGTPAMPQCGFSNRAAQVLKALNEPFVSVNVLSDPRAIPSVCEWADFPTMPQVYVHGELIGAPTSPLRCTNPANSQRCSRKATQNR